MARCNRCGKLMLFANGAKYCKACLEINNAERMARLREEKREQEEKEKQQKREQCIQKEHTELAEEVTVKKTARKKHRKIDGITLSDEQSDVFDILENTNDNYFITGKAGTGKSLILRYFKDRTEKKGVIVVAPTGIAAINVGGQTIHSFFRLSIGLEDPAEKKFPPLKDEDREQAKQINVIIIDEVSMVRADIMDMIDVKLRYIKESDEPFGGCQIITFGDLYQLPPIAKDAYEKSFLQSRYGTSYFFGAPAVKTTFRTIELHNVFRQTESRFVEVLNDIREGKATQETIDYLNSHSGTEPIPEKCLNLVLRKDTANEINNRELSLLPGEPSIYAAEREGDDPPKDNEAPCEIALKIKPGAKIMFIRNDREGRYRNGTMGEVVLAEEKRIVVSNGNQAFDLQRASWEKYKYVYNKQKKKTEKVEVGSIAQYPIILAYAITIHKSQGQTFEDVVINYASGGAFAPGQTYVALSRCKSLSKMHLKVPLSIKDVFIDPQIVDYLKHSVVCVDDIIASIPVSTTEQRQDENEDKVTAPPQETMPEQVLEAACKEAQELLKSGNVVAAYNLLRKIAEAGYPEAQYGLAVCYDCGYGVDKDEREAAAWYEKAAVQGHAAAQSDLAYDYQYGVGVEIDFAKAFYWNSESAKNNYPKGMVGLGTLFESGNGVPQSNETAHIWYERAAELGDRDGMFNTGIDYLTGRGTIKDLPKAAYWNRKAAELGHPNAQYNLAQQYKNGDGVEENVTEALNWYMKAAQNGHPQAIQLCQSLGLSKYI